MSLWSWISSFFSPPPALIPGASNDKHLISPVPEVSLFGLDGLSLTSPFPKSIEPVIDWTQYPLTGLRSWSYAIQHCSASADGVTRDWPGIRAYHTSYRINYYMVSEEEFKTRLLKEHGLSLPIQAKDLPHGWELPWRDIGYHLGLELVGQNLVLQYGRQLNTTGAHCNDANMNSLGVGVCLVGQYDLTAPTDAAMEFLARIYYDLLKKLPALSVDRIDPHRKYTPSKTCPGTKFDIEKLHTLIRNLQQTYP